MAVTLPQLVSKDTLLNRYQTQLTTALSPILSNPTAGAKQVMIKNSSGTLTANIPLIAGQVNSIPTGLQAPLQGWFTTRVKGQATIWDTQDSNKNNSTTLNLWTSANVTIQLMVF